MCRGALNGNSSVEQILLKNFTTTTPVGGGGVGKMVLDSTSFCGQIPSPPSMTSMMSQMHLMQSEAAPKTLSTHCKSEVPLA